MKFLFTALCCSGVYAVAGNVHYVHRHGHGHGDHHKGGYGDHGGYGGESKGGYDGYDGESSHTKSGYGNRRYKGSRYGGESSHTTGGYGEDHYKVRYVVESSHAKGGYGGNHYESGYGGENNQKKVGYGESHDKGGYGGNGDESSHNDCEIEKLSVETKGFTQINGKTPPLAFLPTQNDQVLLDIVNAQGQRVLMVKAIRKAGTRVGIHVHRYGGYTLILKGTMTDFVQGQATKAYGANSGFYMPPCTPMSAANLGPKDVELIDVFIGPPGQPYIEILEPDWPFDRIGTLQENEVKGGYGDDHSKGGYGGESHSKYGGSRNKGNGRHNKGGYGALH